VPAVQKHVNFASPPAVPISPVSYPSSPETTRQEVFNATFPPVHNLSEPTDYSKAIASDPFAVEGSDDDDGVIEQALENAKANNEIASDGLGLSRSSTDNAVKDTLGRFTSTPRRPVNSQANNALSIQSSAKSAMDVDAFKRMLLTGDRGMTAMASIQSAQIPVSDSSSSADTASISQHSIFENVQAVPDDSPRTSDEFDGHEVNGYRAGLGTISERGEKPLPPKSRRGKLVAEPRTESAATAEFNNFIDSLSLPSSRNVSSESTNLTPTTTRDYAPTTTEPEKKIPPAIPVARRKSQKAPHKPVLTRSSSSRYSVISDTDGPPSPAMRPPPPPARRSNSINERRPSIDAASILEDPDDTYDARPSLTHTPSYLKRMSQGGVPPPPPPPRRGRGSSRSSMETTRPSMASLGLNDNERRRSSTPQKDDSRDILADLAALQREVDAAARSGR
jgi:hypothetical protein